MDNQLPSPNTPSPTERGPGASSEISPTPAGVSPELPQRAPQEPAQTGAAGTPSLNPSQVVAALAATPPVVVPPVVDQNPIQAGDVDVIEPEWVDKAEAVMRQHQGDPYGEEEAIEELQEDYLQKRYGINVADPDADDTKPKGS